MFASLVRLFGVSFLGTLRSAVAIRIKYGIDPTAANLHLGHFYCFFVIKFLLRYFSLCSFYFVIGDYTANMRGFNNSAYVRTNISAIIKTVKCFFRCANISFHIVMNANWLSYLPMQVAYKCCVKNLLVRRALVNLNKLTVGVLLYPFYQSYDNFIIVPHIEVGGSDQLLNFCFYNSLPGVAEVLFVMVPLVLGCNSTFKMSKSFANVIVVGGCVFKLFDFLIRLPELRCSYYFFLFRSFMVINCMLAKFFIAFTCLYRLSIFIFIARFFYRLQAFGMLTLYFSRVYFSGKFFNFYTYKSVYLVMVMVTYCFFKSTRAFKKAVSNHAITINGVRLCNFHFILLSGAVYEVLVGSVFRIYICF
ncbi:hypothetical protein JS520_00085 [Candidatus Vidania fulgoroideae]|nr:hypothetical protein JS520_00085 [Candidatus Vidania fulgoroideae]